MSRKITLLLILSLTLNVLFAGVMLGHFSHHLARISSRSALPPEKLAMFDAATRPDCAGRKGLRDARSEMLRLLAAEPFDAAAYIASVEKFFSLMSEHMKNRTENIKGLAKQFTPQERVAVAKMLRHPGGFSCKEHGEAEK